MPGGTGEGNGAGAIWVQGRGMSYSQRECVWVLSWRGGMAGKADEVSLDGVVCGCAIFGGGAGWDVTRGFVTEMTLSVVCA